MVTVSKAFDEMSPEMMSRGDGDDDTIVYQERVGPPKMVMTNWEIRVFVRWTNIGASVGGMLNVPNFCYCRYLEQCDRC